jgi:TonB family protein
VPKIEPIRVQCCSPCLRGVVALFLLLSLVSPQLHAQSKVEAKANRNTRKLVHRVEPVYPQDLKRLNIGGTVKLDVKILPNGSIDKIAIVGGNPILADSAAKAVKQWQYAPSDSPTNLLLNVEFSPSH